MDGPGGDAWYMRDTGASQIDQTGKIEGEEGAQGGSSGAELAGAPSSSVLEANQADGITITPNRPNDGLRTTEPPAPEPIVPLPPGPPYPDPSGGEEIQTTSGTEVGETIDVSDTHPEVPQPADTHGFDPRRNAYKAQKLYNKILDEIASTLISQLHSEETKKAARKVIKTCKREFNAFVAQGADASPSQALVLVMITKGAEDEIQASEAEAGDADKEVLQQIEKLLTKAHIPFWTALASLGKVKEWSASLEISANLLAVKGTGGISVTFGR